MTEQVTKVEKKKPVGLFVIAALMPIIGLVIGLFKLINEPDEGKDIIIFSIAIWFFYIFLVMFLGSLLAIL